MLIALTRAPSDSLQECELTHLDRQPIDIERAMGQHEAYERQLEAFGCTVERLPELPGQPDAVFVEDTVVVLPELAVITRPGAASRRPETASMAKTMERFREVERVVLPGTLEGGDVLRMDRTLYVGQSGRTNPGGLEQLRSLVKPHGYEVVAVPVEGCLHLKTAVAEVDDDTVLLNPAWIDPAPFEGLEVLEAHPLERAAVSLLRVREHLLITSNAPRTRDALAARGLDVRAIDYSELAKAEAGLTCCSVIFEP